MTLTTQPALGCLDAWRVEAIVSSSHALCDGLEGGTGARKTAVVVGAGRRKSLRSIWFSDCAKCHGQMKARKATRSDHSTTVHTTSQLWFGPTHSFTSHKE
eukprot:3069966-Rhodomonas_salina.1